MPETLIFEPTLDKSNSGIVEALDSTLSKIFPHLIFEIPNNKDFWENLDDIDIIEPLFEGLYGDKVSLKEFIMQSQIQPLFFSAEQQEKNKAPHIEDQNFGHYDGTEKSIGCDKNYTQAGGEPKYKDSQLVGFGIPWPKG